MTNLDKMFVVTHKTIENKINKEGYSYIAVNREANNVEFYDDVMDNINVKNANYSELTALYWIWKNVDCEHVGLCHYRRFFSKEIEDNKYDVCELDYLNYLLKNNDIILPTKIKYNVSVLEQFELTHGNDALKKVCKLIVKKDSSYKAAVNSFLKSKEMHPYNMFYAKKELIDVYCNWLFDIMFEFEKSVNMDGWNSYNKRLYGFLSERLFNIWIIHEDLKVAEIDVSLSESFPCNKTCFINDLYVRKNLVYYLKKVIKKIFRKIFITNSTKK